MLSSVQHLLFLVTALTWVALAWKGREPERLAVLVLAALTFGAPLVGDYGWAARTGLSAAGFFALTALALWKSRWWLILAAGVQLVTVLTHVAWAAFEFERLWPAVTLRLLLWAIIIVLAMAGVAEARWARYARR